MGLDFQTGSQAFVTRTACKRVPFLFFPLTAALTGGKMTTRQHIHTVRTLFGCHHCHVITSWASVVAELFIF